MMKKFPVTAQLKTQIFDILTLIDNNIWFPSFENLFYSSITA